MYYEPSPSLFSAGWQWPQPQLIDTWFDEAFAPAVEPDIRERPQQLEFGDGELQIGIETFVTTGREAIVVLGCTMNNEVWEVYGSSRCAPGDKPDDEVGLMVAFSRALNQVARQVEKHADGMVKHAADMQQKKANDKARKAAEHAKARPNSYVRFAGFTWRVDEVQWLGEVDPLLFLVKENIGETVHTTARASECQLLQLFT